MYVRRPLKLALLLIGAAGVSMSCAGERDPRNFVQADVIAKDDLLGKDGKSLWYFRQTVIDAPYVTGFTFVGEQTESEEIRWEVQEDALYARRAYEFVRDTEKRLTSVEEARNDDNYLGAPIAAFKIRKHFDIIRDYNAATGEEVNRVIESEEREWYERKFMRVDWSQNLVANFQFLLDFAADGVKQIKTDPVNYFVSDPNHPDAMRLVRPDATPLEANPSLNYFDFVNKLIASPEAITFSDSSGSFSAPACFFVDYVGSAANPDCASQELKIRNSFMRADKRDYEPMIWDDRFQDRFGYFSTERRGYNRQYGETEEAKYRLINRFQIWDKSMTDTLCTIPSDINVNVTQVVDDFVAAGYDRSAAERKATDKLKADAQAQGDAFCAQALGSDTSTCNNLLLRCTVPYEQRNVKTVVYYLNAGWPQQLRAAAQTVIDEWNDTFQQTAIHLKYRGQYGDQLRDPATYEMLRQQLGNVIELKDNDCNPASVQAFVTANPSFAAMAPAGYDTDPSVLLAACSALENNSASTATKFTWQRDGDLRYSMLYWVDKPQRAGPLGYGPSSHDPETGEIIQGNLYIYGSALDGYTAQAEDTVRLLNGDLTADNFVDGVDTRNFVANLEAGDHVSHKQLNQNQVNTMASAMNLEWLGKDGLLPEMSLDKANASALHKSIRSRRTALAGDGPLGDLGISPLSRLNALRGTPIESAMLQHLSQNRNIGPVSAEGRELSGVDALLQATPAAYRYREQLRDKMRARGAEFGDFADDSIVGLAREMRDKFGTDYIAVRRELLNRIFRGLAGHEFGHTFGLRHNFEGSYDALNYIGPTWGASGRPRLDYDNNVVQGYWELRTAGRGGDKKLGPRYVDPETDAEKSAGIRQRQYSSTMDYGSRFSSDIYGLGKWDYAAVMFGYGQLIEVFNTVRNREKLGTHQIFAAFGYPIPIYCNPNDLPADLADVGCSSIHYTEFPSIVDIEDRSIVPWKSVAQVGPNNGDMTDVYTEGGNPDGRIVVPYRFCSDEFAGASQTCQRYDEGADIYETTMDTIDRYNNYYLFNNFARNRVGFGNMGSYFDRIYGRFFDRLRSNMQFYALLVGEFGVGAGNPFLANPRAFGPWTVAVDATFNHFLNVLATPEPGAYAVKRAPDGTQAYAEATSQFDRVSLNLEVPDGKYFATTWDYDSGYYWYDKVRYIGAFYDKFMALISLADPETHFLGRDTATDLRRYSINYFRLYKDWVQDIFGALQNEEWGTFASFADGQSSRLIKRNFTDGTLNGPNGALPINPQTGFSVQLFAGILGMALVPGSWDQSFVDYSRIFVEGDQGGGSATVENKITYIQPAEMGGKTYYATSFIKDGKEMGLGARMLNRANEMKRTGDAELTTFQQNIDLMRSLTHYFSYTPF